METKKSGKLYRQIRKEVIFQKKKTQIRTLWILKAENTPVTLPLGNITIIKDQEEDITWAHQKSNLFLWQKVADLSGNPHRYEDYVTFTREAMKPIKMAMQHYRSLSRISAGAVYGLGKTGTTLYYLKDVRANTENIRIIKGAAPAYGTDPRKIASGTFALTIQRNLKMHR